MELREGYKETEVGVIPEDWRLVSFEDAFDYLSTASYSRADMVLDGEVKYIHYGDIHTKWNHFLDFGKEEVDYITEEQASRYAFVKDGDIIVADASEDYEGIGKLVEVQNLGDNKAISGLHTFLLRPREGVFASGFPAYLHSNKQIKTQFDRLATGLKVYGVTKTNIKKVQIPLPPTIEEQEKIAKVLSDTDKLIQALERKIEKKKLIKQGAMQELLTPKDDWESKTLGDYLDYEQPTNYLVSSTEYSDDYTTPVLTAGKSLLLGYTNEDFGVFDKLPVIIFDDFTTASKFIDFPFKAKSSAMKFLVPRTPEVNLRFIFELMQNIDFPLGDHKRHWIGEFQHLEIRVPSVQRQEEISNALGVMDDELKGLEKSLDKYKTLKQGLMQQLLTGKTRLV